MLLYCYLQCVYFGGLFACLFDTGDNGRENKTKHKNNGVADVFAIENVSNATFKQLLELANIIRIKFIKSCE